MSMSSFAPMDDVYPESDGKPMSENMHQGQIIRMLINGFDRQYADDPMVLVGGDCFWYPVEGKPSVCVSPDVVVVFETPKVLQPSIRTWAHGGHVRFVVEVTSPSNSYIEMRRKREFYDRHGVDEYWVFDPDSGGLEVWMRNTDGLDPVIRPERGWQSPLLGVSVSVVDGELVVTSPTGRVWLNSTEEARLIAELEASTARAEASAAQAMARAEAAEHRARQLEAELDQLRSSTPLA
jgi:Uma2 family endonuclease